MGNVHAIQILPIQLNKQREGIYKTNNLDYSSLTTMMEAIKYGFKISSACQMFGVPIMYLHNHLYMGLYNHEK
jgi:hypothetical protein